MTRLKVSRALLAVAVVSLLTVVSSASPTIFASLGTPDAVAAAPGASDGQCTEAPDASTAARPCKKCQDRPWCGCTYNGLPRISCNPCCYGNITAQICLD